MNRDVVSQLLTFVSKGTSPSTVVARAKASSVMQWLLQAAMYQRLGTFWRMEPYRHPYPVGGISPSVR